MERGNNGSRSNTRRGEEEFGRGGKRSGNGQENNYFSLVEKKKKVGGEKKRPMSNQFASVLVSVCPMALSLSLLVSLPFLSSSSSSFPFLSLCP